MPVTACRSCRKVAVVFVLLIYSGEWYVYQFLCSPHVGWSLLFHALLFMAIWSYLAAALTDPGTPACPEWEEWVSRRVDNHLTCGKPAAAGQEPEQRRRGWAPGEATWCKECGSERPERAHHCGQCGCCVLRMDHHCPWIGTCVGWRNHKYFLLLNWWTFWASLVFLLTMQHPGAIEAISIVGEASGGGLWNAVGVLTTFVFMLITGGMFWSSFLMGGRNITAVEELFSGDNPYKQPSFLDNLREIFGPLDWTLLLPLRPADRHGGTRFPLAPAFTQEAADRGPGPCTSVTAPVYGSV